MVGPLTFFSYDLVPYREGEDIIVASKRVDRSGKVAEHLHTPFGGILLLSWLTTIRADRGIIPPNWFVLLTRLKAIYGLGRSSQT